MGSNRIKVEQELCVQQSWAVRRETRLRPVLMIPSPSPLPEASPAQPALCQTCPRSCPQASGAALQGKGWIAPGFTTQRHTRQTHPFPSPRGPPAPPDRGHHGVTEEEGCVCVCDGGPAQVSWVPSTPTEQSEHKVLIEGARILLESRGHRS